MAYTRYKGLYLRVYQSYQPLVKKENADTKHSDASLIMIYL